MSYKVVDWKYAFISCFLSRIDISDNIKVVSFYKRIRIEPKNKNRNELENEKEETKLEKEENNYKDLLHNEDGPAIIIYKKYGQDYKPHVLKYFMNDELYREDNGPYDITINEYGEVKIETYDEDTHPNGVMQIQYYSDGNTKRLIYKSKGFYKVIRLKRDGSLKYKIVTDSAWLYVR